MSTDRPTEHQIEPVTSNTPHGEYWYGCTKCGASDWIARYGALADLNFYASPCSAKSKSDL